jgi:hypothetical protein
MKENDKSVLSTRQNPEPTMTLLDVANQIGTEEITIDFLCRMLDSNTARNSHLALHLDETVKRRVLQRKHPVPTETPVFGDFVTITYDSHVPELKLADHDDLVSMSLEVLGGAGILSAFVDFQFAFILGELATWTITVPMGGKNCEFEKSTMIGYEGDHRGVSITWAANKYGIGAVIYDVVEVKGVLSLQERENPRNGEGRII